MFIIFHITFRCQFVVFFMISPYMQPIGTDEPRKNIFYFLFFSLRWSNNNNTGPAAEVVFRSAVRFCCCCFHIYWNIYILLFSSPVVFPVVYLYYTHTLGRCTHTSAHPYRKVYVSLEYQLYYKKMRFCTKRRGGGRMLWDSDKSIDLSASTEVQQQQRREEEGAGGSPMPPHTKSVGPNIHPQHHGTSLLLSGCQSRPPLQDKFQTNPNPSSRE